MDEQQWLADQFEEQRSHLRGVAYRILGSASEADDAVQDAWLKLSRSDMSRVQNVGGWLTTVVARVCFDMLRTRKARREDALEADAPDGIASKAPGSDPEREVVLADSVGLALLVVLDTLAPAERLAFVLHDMFGVPFEEIAPIVGRSPIAARQLASRARRRVQGPSKISARSLARQRDVVEAFMEALRAGDFDRLLAVLDPDVLVRIDATAAAGGGPAEVRGAATWAKGAVAFARAGQLASARPAMVNGAVGLVLVRHGRLFRALRFRFRRGRIARIEIVADRSRLDQLDLAVLSDRTDTTEAR